MECFPQSPIGDRFLPTPDHCSIHYSPPIPTTHHDNVSPLAVATTTTESQTPILDFNLCVIIGTDRSSSTSNSLSNSHSNQVAPLHQHPGSILAVDAIGSVPSTPSIPSHDEIDEFLMSLDYYIPPIDDSIWDSCSPSTNSLSHSPSYQVAPLEQHPDSILSTLCIASSHGHVLPLAMTTDSQPFSLTPATQDEIDEFLMSLDYDIPPIDDSIWDNCCDLFDAQAMIGF